MQTKISGMPTKPIPSSVSAAIQKGLPKRLALSKGPNPKSQVRVG